MFKRISTDDVEVGTGNEIDAAIRGAVNAQRAANDVKASLVESTSLGYREGMKTEVRPAPAWRMPISTFVLYMRGLRMSEGTIGIRSYHLRVLSNAFRNRSPYSLIEEDVSEFLSIMSRHTSRNTVRSYQMTYRIFYRHALQHGLIQSNPLEFLPAIKLKTGKPRPASVSDIRAAIATAEPRVRLMLQLAATAGLRRAEIAKVHTRDLVHRSNGYALRIPDGKGDKTRIVPLSPLVAGRIEELPDGWVFPSQKGTNNHIMPARVGELMSAALPDGVTPHMLRHRFATTAYNSQKDLRAVQELLGHASIATTQIYTEVPDDALRSAASAAADLFA